MEKINNDQFLEEIWNDADFKTTKNPILSAETVKKNRIRKLNEQGKIVAYCKVCRCEMYISTNYNGEFPLCTTHRNPNDRPDKNQTKNKIQK